MDALSDIILTSILTIDKNGIVLAKENEQLEFKEIFDRNNGVAKTKYSKELAAMYNTKGGYLIFGVNNSNQLVGLKDFKEPDSAEIADDINNYFKPAFSFRQRALTVGDKIIFVIHVDAKDDIPTVCIKEYQGILTDGIIYFKYSSQASPMHGEDLIHLLSSLKSQDTKKLVEIESKKMTIDHRPTFGGRSSGYDDGGVVVRFPNNGKRLKLIEINSLTPNVSVSFYSKLPYFLDNGATIALKFFTSTPKEILGLEYSGQFFIENEIGENYVIEMKGKGGVVKFLEPLKL